MVIEELVRALTSPPMPPGPRGGIGGGVVVLASFESRRATGCTAFNECVEALATPISLTSTVTAIAEDSPTFPRTRWREGRFMGGSLSVSDGGISRQKHLCQGLCGRHWGGVRRK